MAEGNGSKSGAATAEAESKASVGRLGSVGRARMLYQALSAAGISRAALGAGLGFSFEGRRDLYEALGWKRKLTYKDYLQRFRRQDIAATIINKPVSASWRKLPTLVDEEGTDTPFEVAWDSLVKLGGVWPKLQRVDRLAGIGEYAVLLIGFDDGKELSEPLERATGVLYLSVYSEENAEIMSSVEDKSDDRYGQPLAYRLKVGVRKVPTEVHWSRVIHVSEDNLESDLLGTPRLEKVFNRLQDLETVVGGSGEMFWRGALPGTAFLTDKDATIEDEDEDAFQASIHEFIHELKRYVWLQGTEVKQLAPQVSDPTGHVDIQLKLIAAATGIPKRMLEGSERGELASSMDEISWLELVDERRKQHCEPKILIPFVDRLVEATVLPEPKGGSYDVVWPDLYTQSDKDRAEVAKQYTEALKAYVDAGLESYLPFEFYLRKFYDFTGEEIEKMQAMFDEMRGTADGGGDEDAGAGFIPPAAEEGDGDDTE